MEVLSYELEKNVAFGRSRREGISSDETVKDFQEMRSKWEDRLSERELGLEE